MKKVAGSVVAFVLLAVALTTFYVTRNEISIENAGDVPVTVSLRLTAPDTILIANTVIQPGGVLTRRIHLRDGAAVLACEAAGRPKGVNTMGYVTNGMGLRYRIQSCAKIDAKYD